MGYAPSYITLFEVKVRQQGLHNTDSASYEAAGTTGQNRIISRYPSSNAIHIIPESRTQNKLGGLKLLYQKKPEGFSILAKHDPDQRRNTLQSRLSQRSFVFKVFFKDSRYFNSTNLLSPDDNHTLFYFSNKEDNPLPVLTRSGTACNTHTGYYGDKVIRAPRSMLIEHPYDVTVPSVFRLLNNKNETILAKTLLPEAEKNQLTLRTDDFPAGTYTLKLSRADNNREILPPGTFYFIEDPGEQSLKGIIEIFSRRGSGTYNLFAPNGKVRSPVFELRFKNRQSEWKHRDKNTHKTRVTAPSGHY